MIATIEHKGICEERVMKNDDHVITRYYHSELPSIYFEVDTWFARKETTTQPMRSLSQTATLKGVDDYDFSLCELTELTQLIAHITFIIS